MAPRPVGSHHAGPHRRYGLAAGHCRLRTLIGGISAEFLCPLWEVRIGTCFELDFYSMFGNFRPIPAVSDYDLPTPERSGATGDRRAALRQGLRQSERPRWAASGHLRAIPVAAPPMRCSAFGLGWAKSKICVKNPKLRQRCVRSLPLVAQISRAPAGTSVHPGWQCKLRRTWAHPPHRTPRASRRRQMQRLVPP